MPKEFSALLDARLYCCKTSSAFFLVLTVEIFSNKFSKGSSGDQELYEKAVAKYN